MCDPVTLTVLAVTAAVAGSVAANSAANKAANAQQKALNEQNGIQAEEISDAAGVKVDERARAARKERAAARVSASESGINLGSNSFLAMLQESEIHESIDESLIKKDENNQQRARDAQYRSSLSQIQKKTGLGIALDAATAGIGAYAGSGGKPYLGAQPGRG